MKKLLPILAVTLLLCGCGKKQFDVFENSGSMSVGQNDNVQSTAEAVQTEVIEEEEITEEVLEERFSTDTYVLAYTDAGVTHPEYMEEEILDGATEDELVHANIATTVPDMSPYVSADAEYPLGKGEVLPTAVELYNDQYYTRVLEPRTQVGYLDTVTFELQYFGDLYYLKSIYDNTGKNYQKPEANYWENYESILYEKTNGGIMVFEYTYSEEYEPYLIQMVIHYDETGWIDNARLYVTSYGTDVDGSYLSTMDFGKVRIEADSTDFAFKTLIWDFRVQ